MASLFARIGDDHLALQEDIFVRAGKNDKSIHGFPRLELSTRNGVFHGVDVIRLAIVPDEKIAGVPEVDGRFADIGKRDLKFFQVSELAQIAFSRRIRWAGQQDNVIEGGSLRTEGNQCDDRKY
nr:hypothetical protein [Chelatococcus asaccharovorans]